MFPSYFTIYVLCVEIQFFTHSSVHVNILSVEFGELSEQTTNVFFPRITRVSDLLFG